MTTPMIQADRGPISNVRTGVATTTPPKGETILLSPREKQIVELVAQGRTNEEIARHFHLSYWTVKNQMGSVFHKLRVTNRTEVALAAIDLGLVKLPPRVIHQGIRMDVFTWMKEHGIVSLQLLSDGQIYVIQETVDGSGK